MASYGINAGPTSQTPYGSKDYGPTSATTKTNNVYAPTGGTAPKVNNIYSGAAATGADQPRASWGGIAGTETRTGTQTLADLERYAGRPLDASQQAWARQHIGYTDPTGQAAITGENYNRLMQAGAQFFGGTYTPYNSGGELPPVVPPPQSPGVESAPVVPPGTGERSAPPVTSTQPRQGTAWTGIGAGQTRTGTQTLEALQGALGRALTPEEQAFARQHIGYTDATGAAPITADQYNRLMQYGAQHFGGQYEAPGAPAPAGPTPGAAAPQPYPSSGPVYPAPIQAPTITNAPGYTAPTYTREQYRAPTYAEAQNDPGYQFAVDEGQRRLEASAAARGVLMGGNTMRALVDYGQRAGAQQYQDVYNRSQQTYGTNQGERQFEYGARASGSQAEYAPNLLTWNAQREAAQRNAELNFDRDWQRELYSRDDQYRRERSGSDDRYRDRTYDADAAWRQYVLEEERRRFLASQGNQ